MLVTSVAATAYAAGPEPTPVTPVVTAPTIVETSFWEGGYVGGQLGYSYSSLDLNIGDVVDDFDKNNLIGGINAGYLWSVGNNWYLGPEFQYDFTDITATDATTGATASLSDIARLKLIAGYEVANGRGMVYASAGVAYANFDEVGDFVDGIDGSNTSYVLGLGYDHRVGDNFTVGGEYLFQRFRDIASDGGDIDVNGLYLKATYRF